MTLLITVFAAVISSVLWYCSKNARVMKVGILCFLFWGASLMWLVDAVVEYITLQEAFFSPTAEEMLNDGFLGLSAVALAAVVWVAVLFLKDPKGTLRAELHRK